MGWAPGFHSNFLEGVGKSPSELSDAPRGVVDEWGRTVKVPFGSERPPARPLCLLRARLAARPGQLGTPRARPSHWACSHRLGGSSALPPKDARRWSCTALGTLQADLQGKALHCRHIVVTLPSHCCYIAVTLPLHYGHIAVT